MIKFSVNGKEIELNFDIEDAGCMEKYESALDIVKSRTSNIDNKDKKMSQKLRESCEIVFDFFNEISGPGTDKQIFGDKVNYRICYQAFESFIDEANQKIEGFNAELKESNMKYSPNRAQRRAK